MIRLGPPGAERSAPAQRATSCPAPAPPCFLQCRQPTAAGAAQAPPISVQWKAKLLRRMGTMGG